MINLKKINKDIAPFTFSDRGENLEKSFQRRLRAVLSNFGLREITAHLITNEFYSFDALLVPQYSPLRTDRNIVYLKERGGRKIESDLFEEFKIMHKRRFGYDLNRQVSKQTMLLSHTTSPIAEFLINYGPDEMFVISKTFRRKQEKMEKTQIDICLCDRPLPEVISFIEILYEIMLNKKVKINLTSDFYYFCEPSFTFTACQGENGKEIALGSGGFLHEEELSLINKKYGSGRKNIIFIGLPYQKLLNLALGEGCSNWNIDYNNAPIPCR